MILEDTYFETRLARTEQDLRAAQRLRYKVFVQELGGDGDLVDHRLQIEQDKYDAFCEHLLLIDTRKDAENLDHVVGAYRMITSQSAQKAGGFYSEREYDLAPLLASGRNLLELGRSCVHVDYRGGSAMFHLWNAIAGFVAENSIEVLFGVASFHGIDVSKHAEALSFLYHHHLAPPDIRAQVRSARALDMNILGKLDIQRARALRDMPALIKGYLRLGGFVGAGAFVDKDFNTTDVFLVMDTDRLNQKQRKLYGPGRAE